MPTSEERLKILKMVQDGKINADEAMHLLEVLTQKDTADKTAPGQPTGSGSREPDAPQWMRVQITESTTGKTRVNVRLPVSLVTTGMKMGARFSPHVEGMDMEQLNSWIKQGGRGKVLDVYDDEEGDHVEVFLE